MGWGKMYRAVSGMVDSTKEENQREAERAKLQQEQKEKQKRAAASERMKLDEEVFNNTGLPDDSRLNAHDRWRADAQYLYQHTSSPLTANQLNGKAEMKFLKKKTAVAAHLRKYPDTDPNELRGYITSLETSNPDQLGQKEAMLVALNEKAKKAKNFQILKQSLQKNKEGDGIASKSGTEFAAGSNEGLFARSGSTEVGLFNIDARNKISPPMKATTAREEQVGPDQYRNNTFNPNTGVETTGALFSKKALATTPPQSRNVTRGNKTVGQDWDGEKWVDNNKNSGPRWNNNAGGAKGKIKTEVDALSAIAKAEKEINNIVNKRPLDPMMRGLMEKAGIPIPKDSELKDPQAQQAAVGAFKSYIDGIKKKWNLGNGQPAAQNTIQTATNQSTGEKIQSTDGGVTWEPAGE